MPISRNRQRQMHNRRRRVRWASNGRSVKNKCRGWQSRLEVLEKQPLEMQLGNMVNRLELLEAELFARAWCRELLSSCDA